MCTSFCSLYVEPLFPPITFCHFWVDPLSPSKPSLINHNFKIWVHLQQKLPNMTKLCCPFNILFFAVLRKVCWFTIDVILLVKAVFMAKNPSNSPLAKITWQQQKKSYGVFHLVCTKFLGIFSTPLSPWHAS